MPSIYDIKPKFQAILRPIVNRLSAVGVTANQVTVYAVLLSFVGGALITLKPAANWPLLLVPFSLFLRMALNAIDGMLAREHDMKSSLGAMLNELGDVLSDVALYLPFALVPGLNPLIVVVVVILALVSEMTGVIAVQIGSKRRYDGPMGKSDRAFAFGLIGLILGLGLSLQAWINYLLILMILLLVLTIINRGRNALKEAP